MQVYTIGHSTHTLAELLAMLRAHGVRTLVDIRRVAVAHIMSEGVAVPATLTPFARVVRGRVHYPRREAARAAR